MKLHSNLNVNTKRKTLYKEEVKKKGCAYMQTLKSGALVEWFLKKEQMSHKKMQKLCYYAQVWSLIALGSDIVPELDFEAWVHGPVNAELYQFLRPFGWREKMSVKDVKAKLFGTAQTSLNSKQKEMLNVVWKLYGRYDADTLESLVHREVPWLKTREGLRRFENGRKVISKDLIKNYYADKFSECL